MDASMWMWLWLVGGLVLLGSELVLPGAVAAFLGLAALVVAGGVWAGLLTGLPGMLFTWMGTSTLLVLTLRSWLLRRFPPDSTKGELRDHRALYGTEVEVVTDVSPDNDTGRIRLDGTSWQALSSAGPIPAGAKAKLVYLDNLVWTVEPLELDAAAVPKKLN